VGICGRPRNRLCPVFEFLKGLWALNRPLDVAVVNNLVLYYFAELQIMKSQKKIIVKEGSRISESSEIHI
jgi:hypothetical protein